MKLWSEVDNLQPGQFMGSTGVQTLTPEELGNDNRRFQAWVKKVTFCHTNPSDVMCLLCVASTALRAATDLIADVLFT